MTDSPDVVAIARDWIGTPYLHQASTKGAGTDCLGLMRGIWREWVGAEPQSVPAYTADWSEPSGSEALWHAARLWLLERTDQQDRLGDVLLFRMRPGSVAKHLGLLSQTGGRARFIHAYTGHGVVETALSEPWRRKIVARFQFPEGR